MKDQFSLFPWPPPLPERPKHRRPSPEEIASARAFFKELDDDLRQHILDSQPDLFPEPPPAPEPQWKTWDSDEELEALLDETVKELGRHSIVGPMRAAMQRARKHPLILKGPIIE